MQIKVTKENALIIFCKMRLIWICPQATMRPNFNFQFVFISDKCILFKSASGNPYFSTNFIDFAFCKLLYLFNIKDLWRNPIVFPLIKWRKVVHTLMKMKEIMNLIWVACQMFDTITSFSSRVQDTRIILGQRHLGLDLSPASVIESWFQVDLEIKFSYSTFTTLLQHNGAPGHFKTF